MAQRPVLKGFLIGCGAFAAIVVVAVVVAVVWLATGPESGVKLGHEMDAYALEYLDEHALLEPDEEILAYYDVTIAMDGTEAAILTNDRVLYHRNGATLAIPVEDVAEVRHRREALVGDVIEIESVDGRTMKIEIAPLNQGETFLNVLRARVERVEGGPA
jgi:hypothetical protein